MPAEDLAGISVPFTKFQDSFSKEVWENTYKDHEDKDVNDTFRRVARYVASAEETDESQELWEGRFFDMLSNFKCTAGGRIYANAGTEWGGTTLMNCISGDTKVLTSEGVFAAEDIPINSEIQVLTENGIFESAIWKEYGKQSLYEITFANGEIVAATGGHEWVVTKPQGGTERVTTERLVGRKIPLNGVNDHEYQSDEDYLRGVQNGLVFGDGYTYTDFTNGPRYSALQQFGDSRHLVLDFFGRTNTTWYKGDPEGIHYVNGMEPDLKGLPPITASVDYLRGFIAGVLAADGHVDAKGSVMLHTANFEYACQIRDIAVRAGLPIISLRIEREGSAYSKFATENSKLWKLTFVKRFFQQDPRMVLKNSHKTNMANSPNMGNRRTTTKCVSVEFHGRNERVYCCEQPTTHTFTIASGLLTGNCFVSPRADHDIDSLPQIVADVLNQAQTLKSEGGWGQNFSWLRPRGAFIRGIGVETPGAVKYMEIYDKVSDVITSGSGTKSANKKAKGKIRKGAMMGVLDVWHPDIVEFITAKQQPGRLTKFNVSVNCTDEFMHKVVAVQEMTAALKENRPSQYCLKDGEPTIPDERIIEWMDQWPLRFPDTTHERYKEEWRGDLKAWEAKGYTVVAYRIVSATWLWNLIMESTYNRAEPGVLFLDRANFFGPLNYKETIVATNPCGEQTLAAGGVCNLGSVNLTQFVLPDRTGFDLERLEKYVRYLNRFLDNINSLSHAPLPEYVESMRKKRRIGIGILGWGSALLMLKVRFGSERAAYLREQVMNTIAREAYMSSIDLAAEKGMFELCDPEKHAKGAFIMGLNLPQEYVEKLRRVGIRNSSLLSIQPTGNTSIFANVASGGLEPVFMPEYIRTVIVNHMPESIANITPKWYEGEWKETEMFKAIKEGDDEILRGISPDGVVYKIDKNRGLTKEVLCEDYGVRFLKDLGEWDPTAEWAVTTDDLTVRDHIRDLKGFARWVDSAMSKTVNVPHNYSFEDFKDIYLEAYRSGFVKGVTTYRAGTMMSVLSAKEEKNATEFDEEIIEDDVKLPSQMPATVTIIRAEGKKWYLTTVMNSAGTRPVAFFVHTNHHEKNVTTEGAIDGLLALAKERGIPERWIEETREKFHKDSNSTKIARAISLNLRHGVLIKNVVSVLDRVENVYAGSFLFQIKKILGTYIKDGEKVIGETCQDCDSTNIVYSEGCKKCMSCGSSKCG